MTRHGNFRRAWVLASLFAFSLPVFGETYESIVRSDRPLVWWRFENGSLQPSPYSALKKLSVKRIGVTTKIAGPRPKVYPLFGGKNQAVAFRGNQRIEVDDPGANSPLDFNNGDAITLEAWVKPERLGDDLQVYILGKGRTNRPGFRRENQNYSLRLRGIGGTARVSFLFRQAKNNRRTDYHRWNSSDGFEVDGLWHHVAVTYVFGQPKSIRGYVDGRLVPGSWDIGGPTKAGPVVDDDQLWIGSSLGGNAVCTFPGALDEVAIYRRVIGAERMKKRYRAVIPPVKQLALSDVPQDSVLAQIYEGVRDRSWSPIRRDPTKRFSLKALALFGVPHKYTARGIIGERSNPLRVRLDSRIKLPAGKYEFAIRSKNGCRFFVNGKQVATTPFMSTSASGHQKVPQLAQTDSRIVALAAAHQEKRVSLTLPAGLHHFRLDAFVGGRRLRLEMGELVVAFATAGGPFRLLAPTTVDQQLATDANWRSVSESAAQELQLINRASRRAHRVAQQSTWDRRRKMAKTYIATLPTLQPPTSSLAANNFIDHWIHSRLSKNKLQPAPLANDDAFLRRAFLDTVGVIPTPAEIAAFQRAPAATRREQWIARLLRDPRWADHWVSFWQDVLAENPGILKPKLNNTGPFRYWIYESLLDNTPLDQFVTNLLAMEGSRYGGGTAGFAMATQNDSPMAAKAHVVAQAFLGINLKCARCHDAPYAPYQQKQLFQLAAMMNNGAIVLPKTSVVPLLAAKSSSRIKRSLKPGVRIKPSWPFPQLVSANTIQASLRDKAGPRDRLALLLTAPQNRRFAQVVVNRIWTKLVGRGLVESLDQWHEADVSHPQLLDDLSRRFVLSGYDLKKLVGWILQSRTYQRRIEPNEAPQAELRRKLFATPTRRRMTAEQVADSLFVAAGKKFDTESLTLDPEGRRRKSTFLNLGVPRRAWEFTSLSNERDRPALALPAAQTIIDLLIAFGWQESRPSPVSERDHRPTILQTLSLANGVAAQRVIRLSDDSAFTAAALKKRPPRELVNELFTRVLSRSATDEEAKPLEQFLASGYTSRLRLDAPTHRRLFRARRNAVSWGNHLNKQATSIKLALEKLVRSGDPPTQRLEKDWRERLEDTVWALVNSPEFVFLP